MDDSLDSWVDLGEILPWLPNEPYFVQEGHRRALVDELASAGFSVLEVDLIGVRTERDLLIKLGQALSAPDYYGKNWDALRDVLRDRGARKPFSVAIVFSSNIAFHDANVHDFVRSVSLLQMMARALSDEDAGQLELFYLADWMPARVGVVAQS
ncbi:barstar family protein [Streptomyces mirabilis]|uniref:barstar family protein n=1 Tax=Streptomyces mirabilis TaxID=68239 RepID=UPI0033A94317